MSVTEGPTCSWAASSSSKDNSSRPNYSPSSSSSSGSSSQRSVVRVISNLFRRGSAKQSSPGPAAPPSTQQLCVLCSKAPREATVLPFECEHVVCRICFVEQLVGFTAESPQLDASRCPECTAPFRQGLPHPWEVLVSTCAPTLTSDREPSSLVSTHLNVNSIGSPLGDTSSQSAGRGDPPSCSSRDLPSGCSDDRTLGKDSFSSSGDPVVHEPSQSDGETTRLCDICLKESAPSDFCTLKACSHQTCTTCLSTYVSTMLDSGCTSIECPICTTPMDYKDVLKVLEGRNPSLRYEDWLLGKALAMDADCRWCPAPDCGFAVIAWNCSGCPELVCQRPGCGVRFCYHCREVWHSTSPCGERQPLGVGSSTSNSGKSRSMVIDMASTVKPCPRCRALIAKEEDGSCNHMTCSVCSLKFCWLCLKEVTEAHFLSPSGCTFWGKRRWSRKKTLLWQIGTILGAPVFIPFFAALLCPVMLLGIPIYYIRKLYVNLKKDFRMSRSKKFFTFVSGALGISILSPLIVGLVVSVGLFGSFIYVYIVVPMTMCQRGMVPDVEQLLQEQLRNPSFPWNAGGVSGPEETNEKPLQSNEPGLAVSPGGSARQLDVAQFPVSADDADTSSPQGVSLQAHHPPVLSGPTSSTASSL